jgi:hypothetical protein
MAGPELTFDVRTHPVFEDVVKRFREAERVMEQSLERKIREQAVQLLLRVQLEAPKKTGAYASAIDYEVRKSGGHYLIKITGPSPLSKYIILGTKPHLIAAKNASVLSFYWMNGPGGPGQYYFRSVQHPGTKPNKFHHRAYRTWLPGANRMMQSVTKDFQMAAMGGGGHA